MNNGSPCFLIVVIAVALNVHEILHAYVFVRKCFFDYSATLKCIMTGESIRFVIFQRLVPSHNSYLLLHFHAKPTSK